jgi:hypothetical protein
MVKVHFIGEIEYCDFISANVEISVTFALVPGNAAWTKLNGRDFGETHATVVNGCEGSAILNHPIDIEYETGSSEGWPFFVCEVLFSKCSYRKMI